MIGISDDAFCLRCHYEGDEQLVIADSIHSMLTTLSTTIDTAEGILTRAHIAGMDIAEGQIILREAISGLVQSRNMVHSVSQERVAEFYTPAQEQAESVIDIGRGLLEELVARKTWLVIALVLIGAFALLLILKIRQVDKHEPIRREN